MNDETLLQRNATVLFSQLDDEYLALDADAGFCYSLNPVGGRIWHLLEQPMPFGTLCAQLQREYQVDAATCRRDVSEMLKKLRSAGLVTANVRQAA